MKKSDLKSILLLNILLIVYSASGVFSKLASSESFLSGKFILLYGCVLAILAIYAIGWQQIIKQLPLTTAYANKAVCTVWGSVWGVMLFDESLSWGKVLGIVLIVAGIVLFTTDKEASNE